MFKNITYTLGVKIITAILNFLIAVLLSQYLGASGKGEQGILITSIAFVLIFSNIVSGASLVYLTPRHNPSKLLLPSYAWSVLMSILFGLIMPALGLISYNWAIHLVILTLLNSFTGIHNGILIGKEKIKLSNILNLMQTACTILPLIIFFYFFGQINIEAYVCSLYISYSITLIFSFIGVLNSLKSHKFSLVIKKEIVKELFRYGFINQLAHIAQVMSFRIGYYFLDSFWGEKSVGIYSNGVSMMESVWMISGSIALVQYSKIVNNNNITESQEITAKLIRYGLWLSLFAILPLILLPPSFYAFIFGNEFESVNIIMRILAPGIFIYIISTIGGHYFSGTGKYHINAFASACGLIATIIFSIILIPKYACNGAALTATISYFITSLVIIIIFLKESRKKIISIIPLPIDLLDIIKKSISLLKTK